MEQPPTLEPASHFFFSDRLKLQFWDWGNDGKPVVILVHGSRDHARSWDWVARALRDDYHVYAIDLRGHGNSAWAPGALYSVAEHLFDLAVFADVIKAKDIRLVSHSLGAIVSLYYSGTYPANVARLVAIEGVGVGPLGSPQLPADQRMRKWIERTRDLEHHSQRTYPTLADAVARMREANPFLTEDVARHLTLHGTNWNAEGQLIWKFDHYTRVIHPFGVDLGGAREILAQITCPTLLFWGRQSFARDPENDPQAEAIRNKRIVKVEHAGHWLHHDQLELFLTETKAFLK
ncbi:MAG: alpha/beta hydrolase [Acidobacteriota bacterium]